MGQRPMETIAVTGHSGFIGRHLVTALEAQGHAVIKISRAFEQVKCDRIYHLACPATSTVINSTPTHVMDVIMDATRAAMQVCPTALFINASSIGAAEVVDSQQGCYNIAKLCMETYLKYSNIEYINYRLPYVYGYDAAPSSFIRKCVDGNASAPSDPSRIVWIAHVDDVVDALVNKAELQLEEITIGQIYEQFTTGRRRLHRPTPSSQVA